MPRPSCLRKVTTLMTGPNSNVQRRCIATGRSAEKAALVRFVLAPSGEIVPDLAERLPGRGVWVSARRDAIDRAVSKQQFARGLRKAVRAHRDLADTVERLLVARIVELLGFARRAGEAVCGFEKCRARLERDGTVLLHARDGSRAGLEKLAGASSGKALRVLDRVELGAPFGRRDTVHVALVSGGLAHRIIQECTRLSGFRGPVEHGMEGT